LTAFHRLPASVVGREVCLGSLGSHRVVVSDRQRGHHHAPSGRDGEPCWPVFCPDIWADPAGNHFAPCYWIGDFWRARQGARCSGPHTSPASGPIVSAGPRRYPPFPHTSCFVHGPTMTESDARTMARAPDTAEPADAARAAPLDHALVRPIIAGIMLAMF